MTDQLGRYGEPAVYTQSGMGVHGFMNLQGNFQQVLLSQEQDGLAARHGLECKHLKGPAS